MIENKEIRYISIRIVDKKPRKVIVDEDGNIVNINPSKGELKGLHIELYKRSPVYTNKYKDELLENLREFYNKNKIVPRATNVFNPSSSVYIKLFGSWTNALKLAGMNIDKRISKRNNLYTDIQLLNYLKVFYEKNGRIPVITDFANNTGYPSHITYQKRFGSWSKALKLVGLDVDAMVRQGILETNKQKARYAEILIRNAFDNIGIDSSGKNCNNYYDGICPNGQIYDVKSSKLYYNRYWSFSTVNKDKDDNREAIQWYYFIAKNDDGTIRYVWRVPGEIVEKDKFIVGFHEGYEFNVGNMDKYDITDKFEKLIKGV